MSKALNKTFATLVTNERVVYANGNSLAHLGYSIDEITNLTIDDLFLGEPLFSETLEPLFERDNPAIFTDGRSFRKKNGQLVPAGVYSQLVPGRSRDIIHTFSPLDDTKTLSLADTLYNFSFMSRMIMSCPIGILAADLSTLDFVVANFAAQDIYGYPLAKLLTMKFTDLDVMLSDAVIADIIKASGEGRRIHLSSVHKNAKGVKIDVLLDISSITLNKECLMIFLQDLSRNKQLEKLVEEKNNIIEQINRNIYERVDSEVAERRRKEQFYIQQSRLYSMSEMIHAVAHQWRQPLNILGLLVQDLEDAYEFKELNREYLDQFVEKSMLQIKDMSRTIDNFRNFFRSSGKKVPFDVVKAVNEAVALLKPQLSESNIELTFEFDSESNDDFTVLGYPNEFKQVLVNFIRNSENAIVSKQVHSLEYLSGKVKAEVSLKGKSVLIHITDNGGGVRSEILSKIFDPYFTTDKTGRSTGLGLYMAKSIIESNMGGDVSAENAEEGLRIIVTLYKGGEENEG